jgi:hypothetical protein
MSPVAPARGVPDRNTEEARRLAGAYEPDFRRSMLVAPEALLDADAVRAALDGLTPQPRLLAELLLATFGAGEQVPERLRFRIESHGDDLWRVGVLLPRSLPDRGATIDPRHYAAHCKINPCLAGIRPLAGLVDPSVRPAHQPPADARWDAIVVAAAVEVSPIPLNRDGGLRKDAERRLVEGLGDAERFGLALTVARAQGLLRAAGDRLHGYPENSARPLTDPAALALGPVSLAIRLLLRIAQQEWTPLAAVIGAVEQAAPGVLDDGSAPRGDTQIWVRQAADLLHRIGAVDGSRGADGVEAFRRRAPAPLRPEGFMLTPDRDIYVAPQELSGPDYGRLCRLAPYQGGDVVHRHSLTREGVAGEIAAGHDDTLDWIQKRSRTGLPGPVKQSVTEWSRSARRICLYTGVSIVEENGVFRRLVGPAPTGSRTIRYDEPPVSRFELVGDEVRVPYGKDCVVVRAAVGRLGPALPPDASAHRWRLAPADLVRPDGLLDDLARHYEGLIPGAIEAAVHAAGGRSHCWMEEAVVLHVPPAAADAVLRDPELAEPLRRALGEGEFLVDRRHLDAVRRRLHELGFSFADPAPLAVGA